MNNYPNPAATAFLRLLGPYLGEGINVYQPSTGRTGLLRGLPACLAGDERPQAHVEWHHSAEHQAAGAAHGYEDAAGLLPELYGFEDLATEMLLPDGRRVVPAVEVAKLACYVPAEFDQPKIDWENAVAQLDEDERGEEFIAVSDLATEKAFLYIYTNYDVFWLDSAHGNQHTIYKLLLAWGFAVGLRPDQYKRKEVRRAA